MLKCSVHTIIASLQTLTKRGFCYQVLQKLVISHFIIGLVIMYDLDSDAAYI